MIDGLMKHVIDPMWESLAQPLVRAGLTPNQVTALGLGLIVAVSGAYLWHGVDWIYGLSLAVAFAFDALDGAVARQRGMSTKFGGYFDAVVDRYQELIVLAAIAWVHDLWALAFFGFSGAVITSYAKARTAIEIPVDNTAWPDLFERLERVIFLCVLLVLGGLLPWGWTLPVGMGLYAVLCHVTAVQRFRRATDLLRRADAETDPHGPTSASPES